jgi:hypothetical protein
VIVKPPFYNIPVAIPDVAFWQVLKLTNQKPIEDELY